MKTITICIALLALSAVAQAQDKAAAAPAGGMDWTKVGPMSRAVTKEDKKGVDAFYKSMEDAWKKGDVNVVADHVDFPVLMLSDDAKGSEKHVELNRDQFITAMKPMIQPPPPDMKMTSKHTVAFLSDTLAVGTEDISMSMGKMKGKWKAMMVLVNVGGTWKAKQMAEAGWADSMKVPEPPAAAKPAAGKPAAPAAKK